MHYVTVGPGALGCLFTSYLARGMGEQDSLQMLDHDARRGEMLNRQGIYCVQDGAEKHTPVEVKSNAAGIRLADVVLLCVKSYDLAPCIAMCQSFISDDTLVVFLQNGVGHLKFESELPRGVAVFGTTSEGANMRAPGKVVHAGIGETFFGSLEHDNEAEEKLSGFIASLESAGLLTQQVDDILDRIWGKLMVNVGINGLTAINGCQNGDLLLDDSLRQLMGDAVEEAILVAEDKGVLFDTPPRQLCEDVCRRTAENISSMLQDVRKKRRTEIDSINGVIVSEGAKLGIQTPVNSMIVNEVKKIEQSYSK